MVSITVKELNMFPSSDPVTFVDYYRANYYGNNIPSENVEFYFVFLRENFMAADNRGSPIEVSKNTEFRPENGRNATKGAVGMFLSPF